MKIMIGVLLGIVILLLFIIVNIKRQMRKLCRQLTYIRENDSNMMLTRDLSLCDMDILVDELNNLMQKHRDSRREYRKKEEQIAQIYTSLSHDIRTPLTSLDGYFQLLAETDDPEKLKRYSMIIKERIASLKEMLEELFTFTKIKNDAYPIKCQSVDLSRIVKTTLLSYYDEWISRKITPKLSLPGEPFYIYGNELAIRRVIQNIIKNGMEHGEEEIEVSLVKKEDEIVLSIFNLVPNPEIIDISQVFERFYKADDVRSRASTGLGLAIARELVQRMQGTIEAELKDNRFGIVIRFTS